jgi:hypothetical protein
VGLSLFLSLLLSLLLSILTIDLLSPLIVLHNQALTSELSKWTLDTSQEDIYDLDRMGQSTDSGLRGSDATTNNKKNVVDSIDLDLLRSFDDGKSFDYNDEEQDNESNEDSNDFNFYGKSSKQRTVIDPPSDHSSSTSEDDTNIDFGQPGSESQLKHKLRQRLRGNNSMHNNQKKSSSKSKSSSKNAKDNAVEKLSARERLKQVRESLELVATKPILHPPTSNINVSSRATISQKLMSTKMREKMTTDRKNRRTNRYLPSTNKGSVVDI